MSIFNIFDVTESPIHVGRRDKKWDDIRGNGRIAISSPILKKLAEYLDLDINDGPWMAGGAVRKDYLQQSLEMSDVDIFFKSKKQYDHCIMLMEELSEFKPIIKSSNAYTFSIQDVKIQFIFRKFYDNAKSVIDDFDMSICQFITDGETIMVGKHTIEDCKNKVIRSTMDVMSRPGIMGRITKYMVYGYMPCPEMLELLELFNSTIDYTTRQDDYDF